MPIVGEERALSIAMKQPAHVHLAMSYIMVNVKMLMNVSNGRVTVRPCVKTIQETSFALVQMV